MPHALDALLRFAGQYPDWTLLLIGLVAFAESLAIVGSFVPALLVMFAAGVLVGDGQLSLAWTLGVAVVGAVAGDAVSYELGRHQQDRVRAWAVYRRYASVIGRGQDLMRRWGALSILVARFTGAVRAFVPLLAGLSGMSASRFYVANIVSALLWAPAHILPGVVFGASLQLAEQASGRLVVLLLLLAAVVWGALWLVRLIVRVVVPLTRRLRARALHAAHGRDAAWARLVRLLLDPTRPGSQALLTALVLLLASMWLFLNVLEDVVSRDTLVHADLAVFNFLQQLRTDPVDHLMVAITEMGSVGVMLPLLLAVTAWLLWHRCWRSAGYWVATAASAEVVVKILKQTLGVTRPTAVYTGIEQYSFPSGHATMSAVVLASLAFFITRRQSARWRIGVGAACASYVALVGLSRLYLGAHWLSDVLGGFSFGLTAVAISAMVYSQHHVREAIEPRRLARLSAGVIIVAGAVWSTWQLPGDLARYAPHDAVLPTTQADWTAGGWRALPSARREFAGEREEAFTLQLACQPDTLRRLLGQAGWVRAPGLSMRSGLEALAPDPALSSLAVLPRYDAGRRSAINLIDSGAPRAGERTVLRLWNSGWDLPGGEPIWYGSFYRERQLRPNLSVLRQHAAPATEFREALSRAGLRALQLATEAGRPDLWACPG